MTACTHSHSCKPSEGMVSGACRAEDCHTLMLALSGHNSELFHSDFLAYLAQCHRVFFFDVMADIFHDGNLRTCNQQEPLTLKREYLNLDIALCNPANEILYVIENKFKSRPDAKQLRRYSGKFTGKSRPALLLLSLMKPDFSDIDSAEVSGNWIYATYDALSASMEKNLSALTQENEFDRQLIIKYINFISFHHNAVSKIDNVDWNELTDEDLGNPALPIRAPYLVLMREILRNITRRPDTANVTVTHGSPLLELWYNSEGSSAAGYFMQFQDGVIKLGLSFNRGTDKKSKRERKKHRLELWDEMRSTPEAVAFSQAAQIAPDGYNGSGYTDNGRTMLILFSEHINEIPGLKQACSRIIHHIETLTPKLFNNKIKTA